MKEEGKFCSSSHLSIRSSLFEKGKLNLIQFNNPLFHRARDSALRAISLTSKAALPYRIHLSENLKMNKLDMVSICHLLHSQVIDSSRIRTLLCAGLGTSAQEELEDEGRLIAFVQELRKFPFVNAGDPDIHHLLDEAVEYIYSRLEHLEVLIVDAPQLFLSFHSKLSDASRNLRLAPMTFMTHSLKELFINEAVENNKRCCLISAKNTIWLLIFCEKLEHAAFCSSFFRSDYGFMEEFSQTYEGLSKVKQLAIYVDFEDHKGKDWWSTQYQDVMDRKTLAVHRFLSTTSDHLKSLEVGICGHKKSARSGITIGFVSSLHRSSKSLRLLRLFGINPSWFLNESFSSKECFDLHFLTGLTNFTVDVVTLLSFERFARVLLPSDISTISLPYYCLHHVKSEAERCSDDRHLAQFLESSEIPNLAEVIVPRSPIGATGAPIEEDKELWLKYRKTLEESPMFKDGKVKLRTFVPGDNSKYKIFVIQHWKSAQSKLSCCTDGFVSIHFDTFQLGTTSKRI